MTLAVVVTVTMKMISVVVERFQHPNKAGPSLIVVVIWMPCEHFKHCFISTVETESSPSTIVKLPPQLSAIVTDIKSQHQIFDPWRKRKLESDAISKFANWSRFPFVSTAPLWPQPPLSQMAPRSPIASPASSILYFATYCFAFAFNCCWDNSPQKKVAKRRQI